MESVLCGSDFLEQPVADTTLAERDERASLALKKAWCVEGESEAAGDKLESASQACIRGMGAIRNQQHTTTQMTRNEVQSDNQVQGPGLLMAELHQ